MITVNWQHIILDWATFARAGTFRVARARARGVSFPIADANTWHSDGTAWAPSPRPVGRNLKGWAPPTYQYPPGSSDANLFHFGFWSIVANAAGAPRGRTVTTGREPSFDFAEPVTVDAKAWYYQDLGVGAGPHGAFIDAFDVTTGDFFGDDFVDVAPDEEPTRPLTLAANNGYLNTDTIKEEAITARETTGDSRFVQYEFRDWQVMDSLIYAGGPNPEPTVIDRLITVHQGNIIFATAFYNRLPTPPIPQVAIPREGYIIIGNLADGPYIIFGPSGPRPVGPWDPTVLKQLSAMVQKIARDLSGIEWA